MVGTLLTVLGFFLSPVGGELWKVLFNRFLAIFAILVVMIACLKNKTKTQEIKKLSLAVNQSPSAIVITDVEGNLEYANPSFYEIYGYTEAEIIGQNMSTISSGQHSAEFVKGFWNTIKSGKTWKNEWYNKKKDGELFWEKSVTSSLKDDSGNISHFVEVKEDITKQKRAEKESEDHRNHLEKLTQSLSLANEDLELFNHSVSHDLVAPVRRIMKFGDFLIENTLDKLDERDEDFLKRMIKSGEDMNRLIESLLLLSSHSSGDYQTEQINLSLLAKETTNELQETYPKNKVDIIIEEGLMGKGGRVLLKNALGNLLGNAWKYTSKQTQAKIEFGATKTDKGQAYFVRDNGVGFDMTYTNKIFAPLQRLHTEDEFPGKGIGLATVRRIIHRHGGEIWAESEVDKGAIFYFTLG